MELSSKIGIKVFCGVELTYGGTDFLVYGLDKAWFLAHPGIMSMEKSDELQFLIDNGAFVIQAHPFREDWYIDHIRLYPRHVHGVEIINAGRTELENKMAMIYAENYDLLMTAGSDNHSASEQRKLAGMCFDHQLKDERDFIESIKRGISDVFMVEQ